MMFSTVRFVALLWLGTLFQIGSADNAFCGCQNSLTSTYITMQPPAGQTRFTSATQCQQVCYVANNPTPAVVGRTNYRHSLYKASDGTCLCTDKYQNVQGQTNGFPDACANPADYDNRIVQTTFIKYPDCYAATPQGIVMSPIASPDSCSIKCASSLHMIFWMNAKGGNYQCGCGSISTFPATSATCGPDTYFIYYHTVAQASAGMSRRQLRESLVKKYKPKALCPKGLTACRVHGGSPAFECVDTQNDIDSCGGCLYGTAEDATEANGVDCYAAGAALGAATCSEGKCDITRCRSRYQLDDGSCIKRVGR